MKYFIGIMLGASLMSLIDKDLVFYKINCDTKKFSPTWVSVRELDDYGFNCLNSNQTLDRETNLNLIYQLDKNTIKSWFR